MKKGVMNGNVVSFSLGASGKVVDLSHVIGGLKWIAETGTWVDYGVPLDVSQYSDERIDASAKFRVPGLPEHDGVNFVFNKRTLAVEANLYRKQTPQELSECAKKDGNPLCELDNVVVASSSGTCEAFAWGN
jgi:hypothetical protein